MVRAILLQMIAVGVLLSLMLFLAGHSNLIVGFTLGIVASMFNCLLLSRQLKKATELPMERAVAQVQIGWFVRLSMAVVLLALSAVFTEVNFLASLAGFFIFQIVIVFRATVAFVRGWSRDGQERGE